MYAQHIWILLSQILRCQRLTLPKSQAMADTKKHNHRCVMASHTNTHTTSNASTHCTPILQYEAEPSRTINDPNLQTFKILEITSRSCDKCTICSATREGSKITLPCNSHVSSYKSKYRNGERINAWHLCYMNP